MSVDSVQQQDYIFPFFCVFFVVHISQTKPNKCQSENERAFFNSDGSVVFTFFRRKYSSACSVFFFIRATAAAATAAAAAVTVLLLTVLLSLLLN